MWGARQVLFPPFTEREAATLRGSGIVHSQSPQQVETRCSASASLWLCPRPSCTIFSSLCTSAPSCCRNATGCPDRLIFSHPLCELVLIFKHSPCIDVPGTCNAFCTQESWVGLFCIYFCPFDLFSSALKCLLCTWCLSETWWEPSSQGGDRTGGRLVFIPGT